MPIEPKNRSGFLVNRSKNVQGQDVEQGAEIGERRPSNGNARWPRTDIDLVHGKALLLGQQGHEVVLEAVDADLVEHAPATGAHAAAQIAWRMCEQDPKDAMEDTRQNALAERAADG